MVKVSSDHYHLAGGLKFRAHGGHVLLKLIVHIIVDQMLVFNWIAGSSLVNLLKTGQDCSEAG